MCGGHIFIQIKVNPPKKCFHSRHGVIWNRACENINIWTRTQNYAWKFISPINSVLSVTLLSLPKTSPSVMWRPTTFETVASTQDFESSSVRICKLMMACSEWASRLANILSKFLPTWFDRYQWFLTILPHLPVASLTDGCNIHRCAFPNVQATIHWDKCKKTEIEVTEHFEALGECII